MHVYIVIWRTAEKSCFTANCPGYMCKTIYILTKKLVITSGYSRCCKHLFEYITNSKLHVKITVLITPWFRNEYKTITTTIQSNYYQAGNFNYKYSRYVTGEYNYCPYSLLHNFSEHGTNYWSIGSNQWVIWTNYIILLLVGWCHGISFFIINYIRWITVHTTVHRIWIIHGTRANTSRGTGVFYFSKKVLVAAVWVSINNDDFIWVI